VVAAWDEASGWHEQVVAGMAMEEQEAPKWFEEAQPIDAFAVDIGFLVSSTLYIGDENDAAQLASDDPAINVPLPNISYAPIPEGSRGTVARLADVATNPSELIHYFKTHFALCRQYGKLPMLHHFWLRSMIFAGGECLVYFPWYDTYHEFRRWANAILTSSEPQVFWDADQGWELEVWLSDQYFYFKCGDPDDAEDIPSSYRFSKLTLRAEIERLINACVPVFRRISEETGLDFFEIEKSVVRQQDLVLLDAKAKRAAIQREAERSDEATAVRPWWMFWK
jgi:hypothetical protein